MWPQANEGYLDRRGCGDEFFMDADQRATSAIAALSGGEDLGSYDELDDADEFAAH